MFNAKKRRWRAAQWRDELARYIYSRAVKLDTWKAAERPAGDDAPAAVRFDDSRWKTIRTGGSLGAVDRFVWLRGRVRVPRDFKGGKVILHFDVGREGELFGHTGLLYVDGREVAGLDRAHKEALVTERARGGETLTVAARVYTGPVKEFAILEFGKRRRFRSGPIFSGAELRLVNGDGFRIYHDFLAAVDVLEAHKEGTRAATELTAAINDAIAAIRLYAGEGERNASFRTASAILRRRVFSGAKGDGGGKVALIGQSHIDMAWLWPRRETILKCASTMANTLSLQAAYPFYNFSHSQAQGFQWIRDGFGDLFRRTVRAAKSGRIEMTGGMWVEADLNCAGGEALARQFLYGQRFFEEHFGVRSRVGWLVDTFGYNWSLPQIMKEADIDFFVSTKPTWNDTNTFPFTTFWWEAPDGSRVLAHIPPLSYGSDISASKIAETLQLDKEARFGLAPMKLYGKSDGGGGPRVADLELIERLSKSPYVPELEAVTAGEWFDDLPADIDYPVYCDEMYVETHRGTYTTQARTKRNNRKAECALYAAEVAASAAAMLGARYPQAHLEEAWKLALFNQFHDILPGSSIAPVYRDAEADYAKVFETTENVTSAALKAIAAEVDTTGAGKAFLVFNPLPWERTDVVEITGVKGSCHATDHEGDALACQKVDGRKDALAVLVTVPSCGWKVVRIIDGAPRGDDRVAKVADRRVETALLSLTFNAAGQLSRVVDKQTGRSVLAKGESGNRLVCFEDIPVEYEAWDIDEWINEKASEVRDLRSFRVVENGPVRTVVALGWKHGKSTFAQRVILYAHTRRVDFATEVDWRERKTLLKAVFPVSVRARRATYEIAFAAIDRSTARSNPWDWARFEVPAHKWADLSQTDYGVSLLNDCKYGCDVKGGVMRLSLLRSPECPDPEADQGRHEFTYSLFAHRGGWQSARTVEEAQELNIPLVAAPAASKAGGLPGEGWFLRLESEDGGPVILSALKKAEDGGEFVARFYEPHGRWTRVMLVSPFEVGAAGVTGILEEKRRTLRARRGRLSMDLDPWKIATVRLELR